MIRVVTIDLPDHLAPAVDQFVTELTERLEAVEAADKALSEAKESVPPNKLLVQGLGARCKKAGREIEVRDVIAMADVDDSEFYKWQRGGYVGKKTRLKCNTVVRLSAEDFLRRLDHAATGNVMHV